MRVCLICMCVWFLCGFCGVHGCGLCTMSVVWRVCVFVHLVCVCVVSNITF